MAWSSEAPSHTPSAAVLNNASFDNGKNTEDQQSEEEHGEELNWQKQSQYQRRSDGIHVIRPTCNKMKGCRHFDA